MPTDYAPLVDAATAQYGTVLSVLVFLFVFLSALRLLGRQSGGRQRGRWNRQGRTNWRTSGGRSASYVPKLAPVQTSRIPDAADQLRTVMGAQFTAKRLLNRGESRVLAALEPIVAELAPGWRVMAQVSLGEVLDADSIEAFNTINAKRVDFLLVDPELRPRHAIEYQGQGHHQGTAAARDAVKKEALRRAGIGYAEVFADDTAAELRRAVERLVGAKKIDARAGAALWS